MIVARAAMLRMPIPLVMDLPLTDAERIEHFDRLLIQLLGGEDVWMMLVHQYAGVSIREIARMYDTPEATVRSWLRTAKRQIRSVGLDADHIAPRQAATISTHHAGTR